MFKILYAIANPRILLLMSICENSMHVWSKSLHNTSGVLSVGASGQFGHSISIAPALLDIFEPDIEIAAF